MLVQMQQAVLVVLKLLMELVHLLVTGVLLEEDQANILIYFFLDLISKNNFLILWNKIVFKFEVLETKKKNEIKKKNSFFHFFQIFLIKQNKTKKIGSTRGCASLVGGSVPAGVCRSGDDQFFQYSSIKSCPDNPCTGKTSKISKIIKIFQ